MFALSSSSASQPLPPLNHRHHTDLTPSPASHPFTHTERGVHFTVGPTFYNPSSLLARDLAVLSASLHKHHLQSPNLRILDAMSGSGIRSLRYLTHSNASFVHSNDANPDSIRTILTNLGQIEDRKKWKVTCLDAGRVLREVREREDWFDFVDLDCFGSETRFLRGAIEAVRRGGLVYVTSTDGFSSGGHRPEKSLAAYGAYIRPVPFANEIGLRMLIGGAVREAFVLGYSVTPLFSYYSYHGPVFRVLLRVNRSKGVDTRHYGFISYCSTCGNCETFSWEELGMIRCPCTNETGSLVVNGPLWIGPLHDPAYLSDMFDLAQEWGWIGQDAEQDLEKLLKLMIGESDPELPPGFIEMCAVAHRGKMDSPPLRTMMDALRKEGFAVSRSHIVSNAIKTNCPMTVCIRISKEIQGC